MIILLIRILYLLMLHYLYFLLFLAISRAQTIIKSMSELNTIQGDEISLTFNLKFSSLYFISFKVIKGSAIYQILLLLFPIVEI